MSNDSETINDYVLRHGDPCSLGMAEEMLDNIRYVAEHPWEWHYCTCCVPAMQAVEYVQRALEAADENGDDVAALSIGQGNICCGPITVTGDRVRWDIGQLELLFTHDGKLATERGP